MTDSKISIVTPSFNSAQFIEETICAVLDQGYKNLEYIIIDGGSSDKTIEIIKKYQKHLAFWTSQPDDGMYDAINKGFERATGEIFAWINSDDTLLPGALEVVNHAFSENSSIDWLHGRTIYTDKNSETKSRGPLFLYHQSDIAQGYHGICAQFVQQHCCFWRSTLWQICGPIPKTLRYAGDYWLWTQFAKEAPLVSLNFPVATFRRHATQLHKEGRGYRQEVLQCYCGSRVQLYIRRIMRQLARRSAIDAQFINFVTGKKHYTWIDPEDSYKMKYTTRSRIVAL